MIRRKIMCIGLSGCGKTSLIHKLNRDNRKLKKTQEILYGKYTIDVPGAYLESPWMYSNIISAAQNGAKHMVFIISKDTMGKNFPPGFAKIFRYPSTGVITKCDLEEGNIEYCKEQLKVMGVDEPYFLIRQDDEESIQRLRNHLGIE